MTKIEILDSVKEICDLNLVNKYIKKIQSNEELNQAIFSKTDFLDSTCKLSERLYCIANDILELIKCQKDGCNNKTSFISFNKGYAKYCSMRCNNSDPKRVEQIKKNNLKKYGVENPSQVEEFKQKRKQTNLEKFGTEYSFKNNDIKQKIKETNLTRYGVENPSQNEVTKQKIRKTNNIRYGCDAPIQNKDIMNKVKTTNLERYGTSCSLHNQEIRQKTINTNIGRYGNTWPMKNSDVKNKSRQSCIQTFQERYGSTSAFGSKEIREKIIKTNREIFGVDYLFQSDEFKKQLKDRVKQDTLKRIKAYCENRNLILLDSKYVDLQTPMTFECKICGHVFSHVWANFGIFECPGCYPRVPGKSLKEVALSSFINDLGLEVVSNSRKIIKPYELDIFIPEKKLAIEFNGLYWHSVGMVTEDYHLTKTNLCENQGIQLIHIFEDEWDFNQDIVKNRIKQILGCSDSERLHARKCKIKEITPKQKNEFLEKYHIQGQDKSIVKLGAFYNDDLVAVMTFSKGNISKGSKSEKGIWELNRFCSNYDYHIPGIASKLLTYFKNNYEWDEIFSYADRRWSVGKLYENLGFEFSHDTKPNYWYSDYVKRIHRFNLRKRNDEPKDKTEFELRFEQGYLRIYDCGSKKYVLRNT